ncbi:hypothetical protein FQR65_LT04478 [Abscondita terminalis]|nr:hypothetical protein FQR65_LT04478 [Abscondita terminalis]
MTSETNRESHDMNINIKSNDSPNFEKETNIIEIPPVDIHDLVKIKHTNNESPANKNLFSQNATNSHPLMYSPTSSPDYPDLIPQKAKCTNYCNHDYDHCKGDSPKTMRNVEVIYDQGFERDYHLYKQVEGVSPSPSLKGMYSIDVRKEPDVIDNDNDNSIYEAHLSSNLQQVSLTMNEKEGNLNFLAHSPHSNKLRLIKVLHTNMSDDSDASSAESITESLRSDDIYLADDSKQDCSVGSESTTASIMPLCADEEKKQSRNWQCVMLPDGEQRSIDMKVIEPYKRVLSHGGYLRAGGNTAIVVFSACYLPDRSRIDYDYVMDNLFLYVLWTLERLVTDNYVLVYLHGGATRLPAFSWIKRCYHMVGRRLRKNLVHLYLVHPTLWIKTMLFMAKPFISSKFSRKITYVVNLKELFGRIPLESNAIPDKFQSEVKEVKVSLLEKGKNDDNLEIQQADVKKQHSRRKEKGAQKPDEGNFSNERNTDLMYENLVAAAPTKTWHKPCFKCKECGMALNMRNYKGFNKEPYCEAHIPKAKATTMAETPELKRIAENTKLQSNVKYHEDFEKSKGKFTQVADDPETLRIKQNSKIISNVAYHGELEKKAVMEKNRAINENGYKTTVVDQANANQSTLQVEPLPVLGNPQHIGKIVDYDPPIGNSPYSAGRNTQTVIYTSDRGPVHQPPQRHIGSVHDIDPLNHNYGSLGRIYRAMYDYEAQDDDEVSFLDGDLIINVSSIDGGWMTGEVQRTGQIGMLPANYVQVANI